MLLAAAGALDRACAAVTVLDGAVVLLPGDPSPEPSEALALLGVPALLAAALHRLPDRLTAALIAGEPDPVIRLRAIEALGFARFFAGLGRPPVDRGPEGELYIAGRGDAATAVLRVVDLVHGPDGGEQVHWISVPPHLATTHEAVAWTFHKDPGAYAPQQES